MSSLWSNRNKPWLLPLLGALAVGAGFFLFLPIRASNLTTGTAGWTSQGCFAPNAVYPTTYFDNRITAHERQGVTLWGSHCGSDASTGELRSPAFTAPTVLELFVSGYAGQDKPGLQIILEREDTHQRVPLKVRRLAGELWVQLRWWTPKELRGKTVRLVAVDHETVLAGWLGISNPRRLSAINFFRQQLHSWFLAICIHLVQWALFLLPGFAVATVCAARRRIPLSPLYLVMVVVCSSATLGYLSFWAFFFSSGFGRFLSFTIDLSAASLLFTSRISSPAAIKAIARQIAEPFLYVTVASLCYLSLYFIFSDPFFPGIGYASDRFFVEMLAGDNVIPAILADRIYDRKPLRPFCCGDWLSSDRPPLQSGIVVMVRPLIPIKTRELNYQLLSCALQCLWISGVWCLLISIGTQPRRIRQVLGFLIFSGFLFYNSVYTWPKLLAATCILFLLSILFDLARSKRTLTYFEASLAAGCLGLALMAHPGSTFSLAVFAVLLFKLRHLFSIRHVALGLAIVIAFYLPWSLYQKYVDPPGNRLLKMHLGGVIPVDDRPTWQTIHDSYTNHTLRELLNYKWLNIKFLAGLDPFDSFGITDLKGVRINHAATEKSRYDQRFYMWNAVGLVNLGWLAGVFLLLRRHRYTALAIPYSGWLIAAALANLLFWSVITFGPYETQTAHSSYADILLVSIGLLGFILTLPRAFFILLFVWQLFNFFVVWVWSVPARIAQPISIQWPMLAVGVLLTLLLARWTLQDKEV